MTMQDQARGRPTPYSLRTSSSILIVYCFIALLQFIATFPRRHKQLPCLTLTGLSSGLERTRGVVEHLPSSLFSTFFLVFSWGLTGSVINHKNRAGALRFKIESAVS